MLLLGIIAEKETETEVNGETVYQLKAGTDNNKINRIFCQLSQEQLAKSCFLLD
jgi:tRNA-specific 2-thiouridylase